MLYSCDWCNSLSSGCAKSDTKLQHAQNCAYWTYTHLFPAIYHKFWIWILFLSQLQTNKPSSLRVSILLLKACFYQGLFLISRLTIYILQIVLFCCFDPTIMVKRLHDDTQHHQISDQGTFSPKRVDQVSQPSGAQQYWGLAKRGEFKWQTALGLHEYCFLLHSVCVFSFNFLFSILNH